MRVFLLAAFLICFLNEGNTQSKNLPVSWKFDVLKNDDGTATLKTTATIDKGWVIYSQHTSEGGPIPLSFTYDEGSKLDGETNEVSDPIRSMSELFEIEVVKFKGEAIFTQKFTPKEGQSSISGSLRFMCCDNLRCLPPTDVPFDVAF